MIAVTEAVLALAVTASWRPVAFVVVAVLGEVSLYAGVAAAVGRPRPGVVDLTSGLPTGASFPSGHVAAAAVAYGAIAALVLAYGRSPRRLMVLAVPALLVPAIALGRVYVAAHHPTDVLAGALLGLVWLLLAARVVLGLRPVQACGTLRRRCAAAGGGSHRTVVTRTSGSASPSWHVLTAATPGGPGVSRRSARTGVG